MTTTPTLTAEARESLLDAIASTPAEHPDKAELDAFVSRKTEETTDKP